MPKTSAIKKWKLSATQLKALVMLVAFTTSFTVFCHCATTAVHATCCCEKKAPKHSDNRDCQGMQAVKFNLLEKQTADHILASPAPVTAIITTNITLEPALPGTEKKKLPEQWSYKHSPPDRHSLYQCFLI